jgi:hypothetical protein
MGDGRRARPRSPTGSRNGLGWAVVSRLPFPVSRLSSPVSRYFNHFQRFTIKLGE